MATDWAEECADNIIHAAARFPEDTRDLRRMLEVAVRQALEKAHAEVAGLVSCQDDCHCFDGDCERVKGVLETIRALGAK